LEDEENALKMLEKVQSSDILVKLDVTHLKKFQK
jgi:hypothetical protein